MKHISFAQGTKHAFWLTAALQKPADSSLVSLQLHPCKFALRTGLQLPNSDAQQVPHDTEDAFWLSAALQIQVTTALCQNTHTYASLPIIQLCNCPTVMHSRFDQNTKHAFWPTAALQKQLTAPLCQHTHLCKFAFHTGLQLPNTDAQQV